MAFEILHKAVGHCPDEIKLNIALAQLELRMVSTSTPTLYPSRKVTQHCNEIHPRYFPTPSFVSTHHHYHHQGRVTSARNILSKAAEQPISQSRVGGALYNAWVNLEQKVR